MTYATGLTGSFSGVLTAALWFVIVLTPIVFVHELGHYWVAVRCGVRVEAFSIGFGRELFGFTDRRGTRWKIAVIPFGGYVKMFGQSDIGPDPDDTAMPAEERAVSFNNKPLWQRTAIVAAGPLANFFAAIIMLAILFATVGQAFTPAVATDILPDSPAAAAGFQVGDRIVRINGTTVQRFEELQQLVRINPGRPLNVRIRRDGELIALNVTPRTEIEVTPDGMELEYGVLGIRGVAREYTRHGPFAAVWQAVRETGRTIHLTFTALGQMVAGHRSAEQLGGPIQIAQMSETAASGGINSLIFFAAFLSINLGLINLFPIPLLDGGHLLFYLYEAVFRRPMGEKLQEIGFKIGLVLVLGLMLFATRNDLVRLPLIKRIVESLT